MKVTVFALPIVSKPTEYYNLPMGLLYLAESVRRLGHEVTFVNLNECNDGKYHNTIKYRSQDADVVMIGGLSVHYHYVKTLIKLVRKYSKARIVLGGGLVTSQPEIIEKILDVDHLVSGECENIIEEVLKFDKKIYYGTTVSEEILNTIIPAYDLLNMELYLGLQRPSDCHYRSIVDVPREAAVIASRGCPYKCTFCFHPTGPRYRQRTLDSVFNEVDLLVDRYNINVLAVYDELFSVSKKKLVDFCDRIKKYNFKWSAQLRVDSVDEETLKLMKDSGCYILSLGIESGSDISLKSYKKQITVAQINKTLELTRKVGIAVQGNILIGAEGETSETIRDSIKWSREHKDYKLNIINVIPYPGTEMYRNAVVKGKIDPVKFLEESCPVINCTDISEKDYEILRQEINSVLVELLQTHAKIYDIVTLPTDPYGRLNFNFKIKCPYCNKEVEYRNFAIDGIGNGVFFCKNCFMRLHFTK